MKSVQELEAKIKLLQSKSIEKSRLIINRLESASRLAPSQAALNQIIRINVLLDLTDEALNQPKKGS